ncbi:MAG: response regulator transcription factor [Firmicutes bacterium]|nr:response regulator transcription factor [Bacillota bacterium]
MNPIRVLLADDHALVREGIRSLLEADPDFTVVGEAEDGQAALDQALSLKPDVILLDIAMPGVSGLQAVAELKKQLPGTRVLILSMHENEEYILETFRLGADGYILKRAATEELKDAIRSVFRGEPFVHPGVARALIEGYRRRVEGERREGGEMLTERERQVLQMIAAGKTNREIAQALQLSVKTVQAHRTNMMSKLNVHNSAELVRLGIQKGWVKL